MAWLLIETPDGKFRRYQLSDTDSSFGRAKSNAVALDDTKCSSFHCVVKRGKNGQFCLCDNGSRNGTLINGTLIEANSCDLHDGDIVTVGRTTMRFSHDEPAIPGNFIDTPITSAVASADVVGMTTEPIDAGVPTSRSVSATSTENIEIHPASPGTPAYRSGRHSGDTEVLSPRALPTEVMRSMSPAMFDEARRAVSATPSRQASRATTMALVGTGLAASFAVGWVMGNTQSHASASAANAPLIPAIAHSAAGATVGNPGSRGTPGRIALEPAWLDETAAQLNALAHRVAAVDRKMGDHEHVLAEHANWIAELSRLVDEIDVETGIVAHLPDAHHPAIVELLGVCRAVQKRLRDATDMPQAITGEWAEIRAEMAEATAQMTAAQTRIAEIERNPTHPCNGDEWSPTPR